jgi:hypothetical protein
MVIKIGAGNVNQLRGLLLNSFNYFRVAVARRANRDARGKIQERIPVDVFHDSAVAFLGHQSVFAGERWRHKLGVSGDDLLRFRARQRRDEVRCFYFQSRGHFFLQ